MGYAASTIRKIAGPEAMGAGVRAAARVLGYPPSTVMYWKRVGYIPGGQQPAVRERAAAAGVDLGPEDFFDGRGAVNGAKKAPKLGESQQAATPKPQGSRGVAA